MPLVPATPASPGVPTHPLLPSPLADWKPWSFQVVPPSQEICLSTFTAQAKVNGVSVVPTPPADSPLSAVAVPAIDPPVASVVGDELALVVGNVLTA